MDYYPYPTLVLLGLVYAWLVWNALLLVAARSRRFSVHTLFAITTLVSAALGLAVYFMRK